MRARYFQPTTGRFLTEDSYWNIKNMVYGNKPVIIDERKDPLGLNIYTYKPDINAIRQSSNVYAYCMNNPMMYTDSGGDFVVTASVVLAYALVAGFAAAATAYTIWWNSDEGKEFQKDVMNSVHDGVNTIKASFNTSPAKPPTKTQANTDRKASDIISKDKKGAIRREFPTEWLDNTLGEIEKAAKSGDKSAQKAKKLLEEKDFDKNSNSQRSKK